MSKRLKDYEKRFVKEYTELQERIYKLESLVVRYQRGTLNFVPKCSLHLLAKQLDAMKEYAQTLRERSFVEDIELPEYIVVKIRSN